MSVEELGVLHQRYVDLSHRFRAAWVFHQFIQSLKKVFDGSAGTGFASEFQEVYSDLKEVSQVLTASETEHTRERLDSIEDRLGPLTDELVEEDSKVAPQRMRQFFHRFQRYDDKILLQLTRFLIYAALRDGWSSDRIDKLDFLLTRISQEEVDGSENFVLLERRKLREVFDSLWNLSGADPPLVRDVEARQTEINEIRSELASVSGFDDLGEKGLLERFRNLKHDLGPMLLEPDVLTSVLEANLAFKNLIRRLYRREERRIVADYQQVFELEGEVPLDLQLDRELTEFRREIESFERRLQQDDFRLGDLARIRSRVRSLVPRLKHASKPQAPLPDTASTTPVPQLAREGSEGSARREQSLCAEALQQIRDALAETDSEASPRSVSLKPSVFSLRLEPREVLAYRRLHGQGVGDQDPVDESLERFLLEGAALRVHIVSQVAEVQEALNETYQERGPTAVESSRRCLYAAEETLDQYNQRVHQLLMEGRSQEARFIEVLRIRMMREYSGLWLLVYKSMLEAGLES